MGSYDRVSARLRWRLWMLLLALGLVVVAMRQLNQPSTARRLGQLFGAAERPAAEASDEAIVLAPTELIDVPRVDRPTAEPPRATTSVEATDDDPLSRVQDNTYFRPSEDEAWFGLFARLQSTSVEQLKGESLGDLAYAQLLKQPDAYRGKVVTIRGTLRREEVVVAPENELGITNYHRLIIQPAGGGHWSMVVYCLQLPAELPRGENLLTPIVVHGFFFKNWSYAWRDGMGIAPVVLANGVEWQPTATTAARQRISSTSLTQAFLVAGCVAALVIYVVYRNTQRPRRTAVASDEVVLPDASADNASIREQLGRMADAETRS